VWAGAQLPIIYLTGSRLGEKMEDTLPSNLVKRLEDLVGREKTYLEDELYSQEAITNLKYRAELEKMFKMDPLGPLPPRQP
jgi:hypothetical protein